MAHPAQRNFFKEIRKRFPEHFYQVRVIDCGSLNVNGSLKDLFEDSFYFGVDIVPGLNVDIVCPVKDLDYKEVFDTVVSAEMLEHSETYKEDLEKMVKMLRPGGLLVISAAGKGRAEHGTRRTGDSWGTSPDYYKNIEHIDFENIIKDLKDFEITYNPEAKDIYFWGIKK
jgi:SAM-dependent methyltransferase